MDPFKLKCPRASALLLTSSRYPASSAALLTLRLKLIRSLRLIRGHPEVRSLAGEAEIAHLQSSDRTRDICAVHAHIRKLVSVRD